MSFSKFFTLLIIILSFPLILKAQLYYNDSIPSPDGIDLDQSYPLVKAEFHDFDNDGDKDILGTSLFAHRFCALAYFTNNGDPTDPNFNEFHEDWNLVRSPGNNPYTFGDIDGDGDLDALQTFVDTEDSLGLKYIHFLENTSDTSLAFNAPIKGPYNLGSYTSRADLNVLYLEDFDGDEDLDLMISELRKDPDEGYFIHSLFYMKNTGDKDNPDFLNPQKIYLDLFTIVPTFADVDNDGDKDMLSIDFNMYQTKDHYIYTENTSTTDIPEFDGGVSNPFNLKPVDEEVISFPTLIDYDNDGKLDLFVSAATIDFDYTWVAGHEKYMYVFLNEGITSVTPPQSSAFNIFPNPASGHFMISCETCTQGTVQIISSSGQTVLEKKVNITDRIDISNLPVATYLIRYSEEGNSFTSPLVIH